MPAKQWDEEESSSSAASSPHLGAVRRPVKKFEDEEDDSDVVDSWDAAEDSEVEREKAKKAAEAKAKADAEAAANKKSKAQRIAEHKAERAHRLAVGGDSSDEDEDDSSKRLRLRRAEQDADLRNAEDLFGGIGISKRNLTVGAAVPIDGKDPNNTVDLGALPLFNPVTKLQFEQLRNTMVPLLGAHSSKAHYVLFLQEFSKQLAKDLPSDQIKKIASTLTALSNEKMKEEKAADKSGKKSKAQKTKTILAMARPTVADTNTYEDAYNDDDDFM